MSPYLWSTKMMTTERSFLTLVFAIFWPLGRLGTDAFVLSVYGAGLNHH